MTVYVLVAAIYIQVGSNMVWQAHGVRRFVLIRLLRRQTNLLAGGPRVRGSRRQWRAESDKLNPGDENVMK